jgi:squalene cyclase
MVDILKSITFIGEKGSILERDRISIILDGTNPSQDAVLDFIQLQNSDGGFPFGLKKGNISTINETTVAMWWMEELDLLSSTTAEKACAYLLAIQMEDGGWDEDPQIAQYDLPPWMQPGDLKTRLYLSAYAAYWLAVGGYQATPDFRKAIHFLLRHQEPSGKVYGYLHNTWIATGVFLMAGDRYAKMASLGIQALASRPLSEWDDSQIAWALDCLSRGGLPKKHPFIEACLNQLFHRQKADGSWASEDGEGSAVGATIQVLKVMKRYGLLFSGREGSSE